MDAEPHNYEDGDGDIRPDFDARAELEKILAMPGKIRLLEEALAKIAVWTPELQHLLYDHDAGLSAWRACVAIANEALTTLDPSHETPNIQPPIGDMPLLALYSIPKPNDDVRPQQHPV